MKYYLVIIFVIFLIPALFAQGNGNGRNRIRLAAEDAAKEYLLNASRPDYDVNTDLLLAKEMTTNIGFSGSSDFTTFSIDADYGLSNSFFISAGMDVFNSQYNLKDVRKSGIGDGFISLGYHKDVSDNFSLVGQIIAKIPLATTKNNLGTGKPDLHLGVAQVSNYGTFGFESSILLGFLSRLDFPAVNDSTVSAPVQRAIDSLKGSYDYSIEPAFTIDVSPSINLSDDLSLYTGISFNRNMRLNYNTASGYAGLNYNVSDAISLNGGFNAGILNYTGNSFNLSFTYYKSK